MMAPPTPLHPPPMTFCILFAPAWPLIVFLFFSLPGTSLTRPSSSQSATAQPSSWRRCWTNTEETGGEQEDPQTSAYYVQAIRETSSLCFREAPQFCLVQVITLPEDHPGGPSGDPGVQDYILEDEECPLAILMNHVASRGKTRKKHIFYLGAC